MAKKGASASAEAQYQVHADEPDVKESRAQQLRKRLNIIDTALQILQDNNAAKGVTLAAQSTASLRRGGSGGDGGSSEVVDDTFDEASLNTSLSVPAAGKGSKKSSNKWATRDESYIINSSLPQRTSCERCGMEMSVGALRKHQDFDCAEKATCCPEMGCGLAMQLSQLNRHLAKECTVARKRRKLVRQQQVRQSQRQAEEAARIELMRAKPNRAPAHSADNEEVPQYVRLPPSAEEGADASDQHIEIEPTPVLDPNATALSTSSDRFMISCEDCKESMKRSQYPRHRSRQCKFRLISCPNSGIGCGAELPFAKLLDHLFYECAVERRKDALVEKAKERREVIACVACGEELMLLELRDHETNKCVNRFVKCKNAIHGCTAVLRNHERAYHEKVDLKRSMKTCLYFEGDGAHLAINEDDIPPPWTVELWLLRPPPEESLRCYLRRLSLHVFGFAECFETERVVCERSLAATQFLRSKEAAAMDAESRRTMVTELSGSIKHYEACALKTSTAALLIELCLQGVARLLGELSAPGGGDPALSHSLCPLADPPGWQELVSYEAAEAARLGSSQGSRGASRGDSREQDDSHVNINGVDFAAVDKGKGVLAAYAKKARELTGQQMVKLAKLSPLCGLYLLGLAYDEGLQFPFESRCAVMEGISHKNSAWKDVCSSLGAALAADQQQLLRWREEAGLVSTLKEPPSQKGKSRGKIKEVDSKKEEKEKAKARREQAKSREKARAQTPGSAGEVGRLTDRIEASRKIASGFETMLASTTTDADGNSCRICIDVGGRVGLVTTFGPAGGSDVLDFGPAAVVPRGRWVHVALTCTPKPNRTTLYIDGEPVGSIKDAAMPLPMASLGGQGGRASFNGALLDARYWRKVRSRVEIARGRNRLIDMSEHYRLKAAPAPPPAKPKGRGRKAKSRGRKGLEGTTEPSPEVEEEGGKEEAAPPGTEEEEETEEVPAAQGAAQGAKAKGPIVDLSADRLVLWYPLEESLGAERVYDATEYRFKTLVKRAETLSREQRGQSREQSKEQRGERRRLGGFKWLYADLVPQPALPSPPTSKEGKGGKEKDLLPVPSFKMRNICQFEVKRIRMAAAGRLLQGDVDCPQGCDERVRALDLRFHTQYTCSMRTVKCRFAAMGCGASFASSQQQEHEERHCRLIAERRRMLRSTEERNKQVVCEQCSEKMKLKHLQEHASSGCVFRAVRCPHEDCAEEMQAHSLAEHLQYRCGSEEVKLRAFRIERARMRTHYPRPWGIVIEAAPLAGEAEGEVGEEVGEEVGGGTVTDVAKV